MRWESFQSDIMRTFVFSIRSLKAGRPVLWLLPAFALSHLAAYLLGIGFCREPVWGAVQLVSPELLRHNLAESLFYLHSQPPLFNLFLGIVLKLASRHSRLIFYAIYLVCGLSLYCSLFLLQVRLGVKRWLAFALATWFIMSPTFIWHQHDVSYPIVLATVLLVSALLLHQYLVRHGRAVAFCFFFCLFLLAGIRSLYHLSYFVLVVIALLAPRWPNRKRIVLAALVPFLLILSIYVKNFVLFGKFTASSLLGMNVSVVATGSVTTEERQRLVREGKLSELSLIARFSDLERYPKRFQELKGYEGIPVLTQARKPSGALNLNHLAYIAVSDQYLRDSLYIVKNRPKAYVKGLIKSWMLYLFPGRIMMPPPSFSEYDKARLYSNVFQSFFFCKIPYEFSQTGLRPFTFIPSYRFHLFLFLGLPLLFIYGLTLSLRKRSVAKDRDPAILDRSQRIVVAYLCLTIAYVAIVGNALETGENMRFRFQTDPFYVVLLGLFIQFFLIPRLARALNRIRRSDAARRPEQLQ